MKSSILKSALVAVAGLALCSTVALQAATTTASTSTAATTKAKVTKVSYKGTVKTIDTAANTITVTSKKGDMTFAVTPMTKIASNKKAATLADITMGEKVSGSYTKDAAGTMTAASIHGWTK